MSGKASDITIGIDFGTTFSGVSWSYPGRREIRLITNWPNPKTNIPSSEKVPTVISYYNGAPNKWGFLVSEKDEAFRWVKILLEPSHKYNTSVEHVIKSDKLLEELGKTADEVVADYLKLIWDYTLEDIRREQGDDWRRDYDIKVVITFPAMWSHTAKDRTKKAALAAGMSNVDLITEPEAAALTVLRDRVSDPHLKAGDTFVVCDAGGGTVDLISYTVKSLHPFEVEEAVRSEGDLCGSVYLNIAFENYLETLIGKTAYASIRETSKKFMRTEFNNGLKHTFNDKSDIVYTIDLPGVEDDPVNGIDDSTITLSKSALKTIFDQVILKILKLVDSQVQQIRKANKRVTAILLVGGFGENGYLYDRIENAYKSEGVKVLSTQGAWSAVCRGATIAGLEGLGGAGDDDIDIVPRITSRVSTHSYGFMMSELWDPSKHDNQDRVMDPHEGKYRAIRQMNWLILAGEQIEEGRTIEEAVYASVSVSFWNSGSKDFHIALWACKDATPPTRKTKSVFELCRVKFSIECAKLIQEKAYRNATNGEKARDVTFTLYLFFGKGGLDFFVSYKGQAVAHQEAKYVERFEE